MISPNPYDRRNKSRRNSALTGRLALMVVLVILVASVVHWRNIFANMVWSVASPASLLRIHLESNSVSVLQAQLASTTAALADRNALAAENAVLKSLLGRPQTSTEVLGAVLLRPPGIPYDTLIIDVGERQQVAVGDIVFGGGNSAIGDISDVYGDTSRVSLFSAPGRSYDAQVVSSADPTHIIPVSLVGQGVGSLSGQIPAGSLSAVGDSVQIPGIGNAFMGSISHIDAPSGSSFETLFVQMPVDIFSLQYVEVQTHI